MGRFKNLNSCFFIFNSFMSQFSFPFSVRDVIIILVPLLEAVWLERMTQSPFASI